MTFSTWACLRCVQELATVLGPQKLTQGRSVKFKIQINIFILGSKIQSFFVFTGKERSGELLKDLAKQPISKGLTPLFRLN